MADVTMPQLGETVTEGTITKWFKQVGDQVAEDEVLFERCPLTRSTAKCRRRPVGVTHILCRRATPSTSLRRGRP